MANWQLTAKTIFCSAVDDEITIVISKDGSARCTGFKKYTVPNSITLDTLKKKNRTLKRKIACEGEQCTRVIENQAQIRAEENS